MSDRVTEARNGPTAPPPDAPDLGLLAQVLTAAGEGVVICDDNLPYVWANPTACRLMGYPLPELVGQNFLMNFPERMHTAMVQTYRSQLSGQSGTFAGTLLRPDGTELDELLARLRRGCCRC